jgi:hypothetical protein
MLFKSVLLKIFYLLIMLACIQCGKGPSPAPQGGNNPGNGAAVFTLQGSGGACSSLSVNGTYTQGTMLISSNTISVQVNVTAIGTWSILTNTLSGFSFSGSGTFTSTGIQSVSIAGSGTPGAPGSQNFTVTAGTSSCTFTVIVIGSGPTFINLFRPTNYVSFFYGNNAKPYLASAVDAVGIPHTQLDSITSGTTLKIELFNINPSNVTVSQTGSNIFLRPGNISSSTSIAQFNSITDTAGKVYVRVTRTDGQNMTITGQTSPVASIIMPLVSVGPAVVGDGCLVAKQPTFTMSQMAAIYTTPTHVNHPGQQTYKLR